MLKDEIDVGQDDNDLKKGVLGCIGVVAIVVLSIVVVNFALLFVSR